jgi:hypothetical protein
VDSIHATPTGRRRWLVGFQVLTDALPFFDERPEFIQLAFIQVIIFYQLLTDLLAMMSSFLKNARNGVLIHVKDARASAHAVAFCKGFEHTINGLFICMKTSEDARVATAESVATFQTAIEWSVMWPVVLH